MDSKREKNLRESAAFLLGAVAVVVVGVLADNDLVRTVGLLGVVLALVFAASELLRSR